MATLDWIVLGLFCMALIGVVFWVLKKKDKDTSDYFLAGRDTASTTKTTPQFQATSIRMVIWM